MRGRRRDGLSCDTSGRTQFPDEFARHPRRDVRGRNHRSHRVTGTLGGLADGGARAGHHDRTGAPAGAIVDRDRGSGNGLRHLVAGDHSGRWGPLSRRTRAPDRACARRAVAAGVRDGRRARLLHEARRSDRGDHHDAGASDVGCRPDPTRRRERRRRRLGARLPRDPGAVHDPGVLAGGESGIVRTRRLVSHRGHRRTHRRRERRRSRAWW